MRITMILNQDGGTIRGMDAQEFGDMACARLSKRGQECVLRLVSGKDLVKTLNELADDRETGTIVAGGGDGTISAAAGVCFKSGKTLGVLPMGTQLIRLSDEMLPGERVVHDEGRPLTGAMRIVRRWHHRMAVSDAGDGRTRFRDTLDVGAGLLTPVAWLGFWVFWQLRARQLRRLAPGWAAQFGATTSPGGAA